jgi:single-stranded DNA-binding protein
MLGAVFRTPEVRTSKSGRPYATATLKVNEGNTADFWRVFAFSENTRAELSRLSDGDKITVQGSLKIEVYVSKDGEHKLSRTVFADHVLALRQPPRERKTKEKQKQGEHAQICARGDYPSEARAVAAVLNAGRRA